MVGSVTGFVWNDLDLDGIQDPGEPGLAGATVTLEDSDLNVVGTFVTGADGIYTFEGLEPDEYGLFFSGPAGFGTSLRNEGNDDTLDSDIGYDFDPDFGSLFFLGNFVFFDLADGQTIGDIDAGFIQSATFNGSVWDDLNGNNVRDLDEPGIEGVALSLDSSFGDFFELETDEDGDFSISVTALASYSLTLFGSSLPNGASLVTPNAGPDDSIDSDFEPTNIPNFFNTPLFPAAPGSVTTLDAGFSFPDFVIPTLSANFDSGSLRFENEGDAGTTNFDIIFELDQTTTVDVTFTATFVDQVFTSNPLESNDFASPPFSTLNLTIPAGQTQTTVTIEIAGDEVVEADEFFAIDLSNIVNAEFVSLGNRVVGRVDNDDIAPLSTDDFNTNGVLSPIWQDPAETTPGSSSIALNSNPGGDPFHAWLEISAPAGESFSTNAGTSDSIAGVPRLLQQVPDQDFTLTANFLSLPPTPDFPSGSSNHGLIVSQSDTVFIEYLVFDTGSGPSLFAESIGLFSDDTILSQFGSAVVVPPTHLRISRTNNEFVFEYSEDGNTWYNAIDNQAGSSASFTENLTVSQIGPFAGSNTTADYTAQVDYIFAGPPGELASYVANSEDQQNGSTSNTAPVAVDDMAAGPEGDLAIAGNVLNNDMDGDGDSLSVVSVNGVSVGTQTPIFLNGESRVVVSQDGSFEYFQNSKFNDLNDGESGSDTFSYVVSDGNGGSDTADVTITIAGVTDTQANTPPVANDDQLTTDEDTPLTVSAISTLFGLLSNDSDADGDGLTLTNVDQSGLLGTLTNNLDGTVTYDPGNAFQALNNGESGIDSFTYTISDGEGGSDSATVNIIISGVTDDTANNPPVAVDDSGAGFTTQEDVSFDTASVVLNDFDPDGDDFGAVSFDTTGTIGTVLSNMDGTFNYAPASGFAGTDSFSYTIADSEGASDTATVTITVNPLTPDNTPPVAVDDSGAGFTTQEDVSFDTASVVLNDFDPDGDDFGAVSFDTTGTIGTVFSNMDGTFNYAPASGFAGTDSFTYTIADSEGASDTATVTITVNPLTPDNTPPVAVDDSGAGFTTDEDTPFATANVLTNDSDADGDTLFPSSLDTSGTLGSVSSNMDGTFNYDPSGAFESLDNGESAVDSFKYTVSDGNGGESQATVTITVNGVTDSNGSSGLATLDIGLYDAADDSLIQLITEGAEISTNAIMNKKVTIAAFIPDDSSFFGQAESMFVDLNNGTAARTENIEPYSLFTDIAGDFAGQNMPFIIGANKISFDVYSADGLGGDMLGSVTRNFSLVEPDLGDIGASEDDLKIGLYDAETNQLIEEIDDGDQISSGLIDGKKISFAASVAQGSALEGQVESVRVSLNDGPISRVENIDPFALFGDINGDFFGEADFLPAGPNQLTFELYSQDNAQGAKLGEVDIDFDFVDIG